MQHSWPERQSFDWATNDNHKFIDIEDDNNFMEMAPIAPGLVAGAQDDGMQTDGEET